MKRSTFTGELIVPIVKERDAGRWSQKPGIRYRL